MGTEQVMVDKKPEVVVEQASPKLRPLRDRMLSKAIHIFEYFGLLVISLATVYASIIEALHMVNSGVVTALQHSGNFQSPINRRPRILRIFQQAI